MRKVYPNGSKRNLCFLYFKIGDPRIPQLKGCFTIDNYLYAVSHIDYNYDSGEVEVRGYCNYWGSDLDKQFNS
ncbi:hypothetical protein D0T60_01330 [Bacteroides sp. 224]|nr:hypothetical protein [Bacteroides sp. 224]